MEDEKKLVVLEGVDSYLPHVDGVINCMHNYCINSYKDVDITAVGPAYKNYEDKEPYKIIRCKSVYIPILGYRYARATKDKKFKEEILSKKYDIIHVNSPFNMADFALDVAKKQGIPAVTTFHSNMRLVFRLVVKSKWIAEKMVRVLGRKYNKFDEVFVCSPAVEELCRSFGYTGKISYLPLGTKIPKCTKKAELSKQANEKFGFSDDDLVFVFVGRIEKTKRVDFILKSLKILKDKGIKFKLFVIGDGAEFKKAVKLKNKLGFTDAEVEFTGFLQSQDFLLHYARANLLLFPSVYDTFGLIKVEASAYDTPGVFIEGSCAGYGITHGVNGYLSKNTTEDFASTIENAISDRAKLAQVGKKAGEDLYITWEECTKQFIEKLKQIVNEKSNKTQV